MRKEIEVKARVKDFDTVLKKLKDLGCKISEQKIQEDTIFVDFEGQFIDHIKPGINYLRIRKSGGKILFTIKQPQSNALDRIEHELEISDADEMREAIILMGYREAIKIHKTRRKTDYGEYEICLDEVKGLGSFIEAEKITDDEDAEKVQKELFDFLVTLGVDKKDKVIYGYDILMDIKNNSSK